MKYGLPKEERSKKKWRETIENEMKCLKLEVNCLKEKLKGATDIISQLSENKYTHTWGFGKTPFHNSGINNNNTWRKSGSHVFSQGFNINSDHMFSCNHQIWLQGPSLPPCGTENPGFQPIWDYDVVGKKAIKYNTITCMPRYMEKSLEELRFEDYILKGISFSHQVQRYKDALQRSSRTEMKRLSSSKNKNQWWKIGDRKHSGENKSKSFYFSNFCPTVTENPFLTDEATSMSSSLLEDLKKYEPLIAEHRRNEGISNSKNGDCVVTDESIGRQIISHLNKLGEQITSVNEKFSKMDLNIADISSRVSVMDSRLSAIDMCMMMQRFDKKWQCLESRLSNLQSNTVVEIESSPKKSENISNNLQEDLQSVEGKDISCALDENKVELNTENKCESKPCMSLIWEDARKILDVNITTDSTKKCESKLSKPKIVEDSGTEIMNTSCVTEANKECENKLCSHQTLDGDEVEVNTKSVDCTSKISDDQRKPLQKCEISNSSVAGLEETNLEMSVLETTYVSISYLDSTTEQVAKFSSNESILNDSLTISSISCEKDHVNESANKISISETDNNKKNSVSTSSKLEQISVVRTPPENKGLITDTNSAGTVEKKDSSTNTEVKSDILKDDENNIEKDFVFVERSDIVDSADSDSKVKDSTVAEVEASLIKDYKLCNNITEYLEVNLGKKKDFVYEFGFEVKQDYTPEQDTKSNVNQAASSSPDDSFQTFMNNLIKNKSAAQKQSSPFNFTSKEPNPSTVLSQQRRIIVPRRNWSSRYQIKN